MCIRQYAIAYRNVWHGLYELLIFWLLIWTKAAGRKSIIFFTQRVRIRCCGFQSRGKIICQHRLELFCAPLSRLGSTLSRAQAVRASCVFAALSRLKWRKGSFFTPAWTYLFHCAHNAKNRLIPSIFHTADEFRRQPFGVAREKNVNLKYID